MVGLVKWSYTVHQTSIHKFFAYKKCKTETDAQCHWEYDIKARFCINMSEESGLELTSRISFNPTNTQGHLMMNYSG